MIYAYKRVLLAELPAAEADGWSVVGGEKFSEGISVLVQKTLRDPEPTPTTLDVTGLGPDEYRVAVRVVERLRLGFARYGPLDIARNPKDWKREASEEFLDGAIYLAMESLRNEGK